MNVFKVKNKKEWKFRVSSPAVFIKVQFFQAQGCKNCRLSGHVLTVFVEGIREDTHKKRDFFQLSDHLGFTLPTPMAQWSMPHFFFFFWGGGGGKGFFKFFFPPKKKGFFFLCVFPNMPIAISYYFYLIYEMLYGRAKTNFTSLGSWSLISSRTPKIDFF